MGALALLYSAAPLGQAQAAEGHDNCDETITSVGAVIARPGTYCLKAGITSALTSGAAITINADNVTIDCNGHVIRDATTSDPAYAVAADDRENVTVRNGIEANAPNTVVRRNRVLGVVGLWAARGISTYGADVIENTVAGVRSAVSSSASGKPA